MTASKITEVECNACSAWCSINFALNTNRSTIGAMIDVKKAFADSPGHLLKAATIMVLCSNGAHADDRYAYECSVNKESRTDKLVGFKLEWTDVDSEVPGYAVAQELRLNSKDITGDHGFIFEPDAYISLNVRGDLLEPKAFFPVEGDHNKNVLMGFFLGSETLYSLSVQTWEPARFTLVQHKSCAQLLPGGQCKDAKVIEGHCISTGEGKEFQTIDEIFE